eukprot:gnl/MRDRNA2_/MRDRNA2_83405_c0_seq1.p1 gnl/MRDRNA2_/MRDRNA2_83405_c0~~gnl/MRDRNA2_/MRDRNA2_83405_c0_seq1.p1  ORF type:complete len:784 (+),score=249.72 gnl/MRDRNA2_/MRDRNA2_83405_c0_seq1:155-2353(+)
MVAGWSNMAEMPESLAFVLFGDMIFTIKSKKYACKQMRLALGDSGGVSAWWLGAPTCKRTAADEELEQLDCDCGLTFESTDFHGADKAGFDVSVTSERAADSIPKISSDDELGEIQPAGKLEVASSDYERVMRSSEEEDEDDDDEDSEDEDEDADDEDTDGIEAEKEEVDMEVEETDAKEEEEEHEDGDGEDEDEDTDKRGEDEDKVEAEAEEEEVGREGEGEEREEAEEEEEDGGDGEGEDTQEKTKTDGETTSMDKKLRKAKKNRERQKRRRQRKKEKERNLKMGILEEPATMDMSASKDGGTNSTKDKKEIVMEEHAVGDAVTAGEPISSDQSEVEEETDFWALREATRKPSKRRVKPKEPKLAAGMRVFELAFVNRALDDARAMVHKYIQEQQEGKAQVNVAGEKVNVPPAAAEKTDTPAKISAVEEDKAKTIKKMQQERSKVKIAVKKENEKIEDGMREVRAATKKKRKNQAGTTLSQVEVQELKTSDSDMEEVEPEMQTMRPQLVTPELKMQARKAKLVAQSAAEESNDLIHFPEKKQKEIRGEVAEPKPVSGKAVKSFGKQKEIKGEVAEPKQVNAKAVKSEKNEEHQNLGEEMRQTPQRTQKKRNLASGTAKDEVEMGHAQDKRKKAEPQQMLGTIEAEMQALRAKLAAKVAAAQQNLPAPKTTRKKKENAASLVASTYDSIISLPVAMLLGFFVGSGFTFAALRLCHGVLSPCKINSAQNLNR